MQCAVENKKIYHTCGGHVLVLHVNVEIVHDQFAEHHIRPAEPFARVLGWIIHVDAFVHEMRTGVGGHETVENMRLEILLSLVIASMDSAMGHTYRGGVCGEPMPLRYSPS